MPHPNSFQEAVAAFCARLSSEGRATATISAYRNDLLRVAQVAQQIAPEVQCQQVTAGLLDQLLAAPQITHTLKGPRSAASLHRIKAALRAFFAWALETGIVATNPARLIRMHRLPRKLPVFLTEQEKMRLLKEIRGRADFASLRDRLMLELLLGTGIRLGELAALDLLDIDLDAKHMRVLAKGSVPQIKFLKTDLRVLLRRYLMERRRQPGCKDPLLLSNRGTRLCHRQIAYRLQFWLRKASILKDISPHGMRHTFATHLYSATNDLLVVQRALGHRDVSTTQIYTHLVDGQLEQALERL